MIMTNNYSDYQKEVFMKIYQTSLGAMLSTNQYPDSIAVNAAICDSAKIAMASVSLLTEGDDLRKPSDIIAALNDRRSDEPLEFPDIEE